MATRENYEYSNLSNYGYNPSYGYNNKYYNNKNYKGKHQLPYYY